jgi:excisionase family DNA binding protein
MAEFLTTKEVAKLLGIAVRTVRVWAECGELPCIKVGRQWRFRKTKLSFLLQKPTLAASTAYKKATVAHNGWCCSLKEGKLLA